MQEDDVTSATKPPPAPAHVTAFPKQYARTRHFAAGEPRDFEICLGGKTVVFLRTRTGADPVNCLWRLDVDKATTRMIVDPHDLVDVTSDDVSEWEIGIRERKREYLRGITSYALDKEGRLASFALNGRLWLADMTTGKVGDFPARSPVFDPRLDPTGALIAYVDGPDLRIVEVDGSNDRCLAASDHPDVAWGTAEFIAAEEMGRTRGYWWSPDGSALLAARVDNRAVTHYYIAHPIDPTVPPRRIAYPMVGTPNAVVSLSLIGLDGTATDVEWDAQEFEYLVAAQWTEQALLVLVQDRSQRRMQVLDVDPASGKATVRHSEEDKHWLHIVPGVPALTASGQFVWSAVREGSRRLMIDGQPVTPLGLDVRRVADVDLDVVLFTASDDPTEIHLWSWSAADGLTRVSEHAGVHEGHRSSGTTIVVSRALDDDGTRVTVRREGASIPIESVSESPTVRPQVEILSVGADELRSVVLLPSDHRPGADALPVLLDPYGGPASQRVLASREQYLVSQWFADQGFAVIVTDGHGTLGRGRDWELSVENDSLSLPLADQVNALQELARHRSELDLSRVAIRGWSFGGFMATAAVLRRPDVFHAAIAGAPDYDSRLYDTNCKERYLDHPDKKPENYDRTSLISEAANLDRPLLIIHGLADDNVLFGHTVRFTNALLAAARPYNLIVLSGVTHTTPDPTVTENLLLLELDFLRRTFTL
jgi:dipeptidyl-peptidase 4